MKLNNYNFFKINKVIVFLGLFLYQFLSYGEIDSSLSGNQTFDQEMSEINSLETLEGEKNSSHFLESSLLSLKGESLAVTSLFFGGIKPMIPILLEFQTPVVIKSRQLKWLIQTGAGISFYKNKRYDFQGLDNKSSKSSKTRISELVYFLFDTGLRYDFQPLTISLTLGGYITPASLMRKEKEYYIVNPILGHTRWALSIGWGFLEGEHVALTAGSFAGMSAPFLGLSASVPLKKW